MKADLIDCSSDLRPDTLGMLLSAANVRAGSKVLVLDDCFGIVVAAALERMDGLGILLASQSASQINYEAM